MRIFSDSSQNHKGFVDVCVAVKWLHQVKSQLFTQRPELLKKEQPALQAAPSKSGLTTASAATDALSPTSKGSASASLTTLGTAAAYTTQSPPPPSPSAAANGLRPALIQAMQGMGFKEQDICKCSP